MGGLQPGERAPNFKRLDSEGTAQVFYELHQGQPMLLVVLPDDESASPPEVEKALFADHPLWREVSRIALKNAEPQACSEFEERRQPGFPVLSDDTKLTAFLTGREIQDRLALLALDENLRLLKRIEPEDPDAMLDDLRAAYEVRTFVEPQVIRQPAPVLILPRVFDDDQCAELVDIFEKDGGHESGVLYLEGDKQRWAPDYGTKRRRDVYVKDEALTAKIRDRLRAVLLPEIERCFQFQVTHHEPFKLVRYGGEEPGYFRPHRDNVTQDAAHRRFAMTLNLNDPDSYRGGQLRFPEHSPHLYQTPKGGAIVFSCSLVHEALDVTEGYRYALLGFFYN